LSRDRRWLPRRARAAEPAFEAGGDLGQALGADIAGQAAQRVDKQDHAGEITGRVGGQQAAMTSCWFFVEALAQALEHFAIAAEAGESRAFVELAAVRLPRRSAFRGRRLAARASGPGWHRAGATSIGWRYGRSCRPPGETLRSLGSALAVMAMIGNSARRVSARI
jgi:hypothetical protein